MSSDHAVRIDFKIDSELSEDMHHWWRSSHGESWAFEHMVFEAPVFLEIGEVVLLDWVLTPLYSIARGGSNLLQELPQTRSAEIELPRTSYRLLFEGDDRTVKVTEGSDGISASTTYSQLLGSWQDFAARVRSFVVTEFPDILKRSDDIGDWFREGE